MAPGLDSPVMDPTDAPPPHDPLEPNADDTGLQAAGTEQVGAPPLAPPSKRGRVVVLAIAIAVSLLAAGTVIAVRNTTEATELATLVPADAMLYASVQITPTGSQADALRGLLRRLPQERRTKVLDGITDGLDDLFSEAGLKYETDVEPWLGGSAAVALRPAAEGSTRGPIPVVLIEVDDPAAARAAFAKAKPKLEDTTYVVEDGVAYVAQKRDDIDAFRAAVAPRGALTTLPAYTQEVSKIGDSLALLWVDGSQLQKSAGGLFGPGMIPGIPSGTAAQNPADVLGAVGLRATDEGFELVGHSTSSGAPPTIGGELELLEQVPSGIMGSLSIFNPAAIIDQVAQAMSMFGGGFGSTVALRPASAQTPGFPFGDDNPLSALGLDLEKDLQAWLGGELSVVLGGISAPPVPDMAILVAPSDEAALDRALGKLRKNLGNLGLSVEPTSNGFNVNAGVVTVGVVRAKGKLIIASSPAYASTLSKAATDPLGNDSVYRRTFSSGSDGTMMQLYLRLDRIQSLIETFIPASERAEYEADVKPILDEFQSVGMRATVTGNEGTFSLKLLVRK